MKNVFKQIVDTNGVDILSTPKFFIGAFCDLSPSSTDIKALRYAMDQGINRIIYNAYLDKNTDPLLTRSMAISRLVTEASLSKEKSTQIVDGLFFAIGWDINVPADETMGPPSPAPAESSPALTLEIIRKAAERGDADAQCRLGDCYYSGIGVEKNRKIAVGWYLKAAEQGWVDAQNALARIENERKQQIERLKKVAIFRVLPATMLLIVLVFLSFIIFGKYNNRPGPFVDVSVNHWAISSIVEMEQRGVVSGYSDGSFLPDSPAEQITAVLMTVRSMGEEEAIRAIDPSRTLAIEAPQWVLEEYKRELLFAVDRGLIVPSEDNFNADASADRAWVAQLLVRMVGKNNEVAAMRAVDTGFTDQSSIPEWALPYVKVAVDSGIINGYSDGSFAPNNRVSRAELVTMLTRTDSMIEALADLIFFGTILEIGEDYLVVSMNERIVKSTILDTTWCFDNDGKLVEDYGELSVGNEIKFMLSGANYTYILVTAAMSADEIAGDSAITPVDYTPTPTQTPTTITPTDIDSDLTTITQAENSIIQTPIISPENGATQTLDETRKAADHGDADAQYRLGESYFYGQGVEKNYEEAVELYRKSAEQGHADALFRLGGCYYFGYGVEIDDMEALNCFRKAAEQSNASAQMGLATMYFQGRGVDRNYEEAVKWYRIVADQGINAGQAGLGLCYYYGLGVEKNYHEAFVLCHNAADLGSAANHCIIGECYYYGRGVEKNYEEAVKWYRLAADQGYASAQYNLGYCYYSGHGVEPNYEQAEGWYRQAAEQGHAAAQEALDNL